MVFYDFLMDLSIKSTITCAYFHHLLRRDRFVTETLNHSRKAQPFCTFTQNTLSKNLSMSSSKSLTYTSYLNIDKLLELQQPESEPEEHDEMLFIIIHQVYELWFKQILHEFDKLRTDLENGRTWASAKTLRRILTILKTMVSQIDILETMTPLEFNSFRRFLQNASGFQSVQFREMEIICGLRSKHIIEVHSDQPELQQQLIDREKESTLWESFCLYLKAHGHDIEFPERVNEQGLVHEPSQKNQSILIEIMNDKPELAHLCELFV